MSPSSRLASMLPLDPDDALPFVRGCFAGAAAPDLGEAFYVGYQSALHRLVPALAREEGASFCVTESGGGHPRAMRTAVVRTPEGLLLEGRKSFVTGADRAATLVVVACEGERADGTPALRIATVRADAQGVRLEPLPPTPFAPGIRHAAVTFDRVSLAESDLLPGDGYADYVRPFRTVEDVHVLGAVVAHLVSRFVDLPTEAERVERLLAILAALRTLAPRDPSATATHLALAGVLSWLTSTLDTVESALSALPVPDVANALRRDLALLRVAESARRSRRNKAWAWLGPSVSAAPRP